MGFPEPVPGARRVPFTALSPFDVVCIDYHVTLNLETIEVSFTLVNVWILAKANDGAELDVDYTA